MAKKINAAMQELERQNESLKAELEKYKQEAQRNYRMLESINNSTHLSIWIAYFDEEGNPAGIHFTDEMRRGLGYSKNELEDTVESLTNIIHPDDADRVLEAYQNAIIDKDAVYDVDYRLLMKSGEYRMCHAAGECVRREDGTPEFFIGTFTDIQEQLDTKEMLDTNQKRQEAIESMMFEGTWSVDLTKYDFQDRNAKVIYSDQVRKILGYDGLDDFPNVMSTWLDKTHPDDLKASFADMGEIFESPTGKRTLQTEYRMLHKNGEYRWVSSLITVVWSDDQTRPIMAAGIILDITEEKVNRTRFKEELTPKIQAFRDGIKDIATTVGEATTQMSDVAMQQEDMVETAKKIREAVDASMEIIGGIKAIADQTNLLSLNASIEAARAGEAGRGFAVVATEVQNLSNSSKETTDHISEILEDMNSGIKDMLEKISVISESVTVENEEMEKINSTVGELSTFADELGDIVNSLFA